MILICRVFLVTITFISFISTCYAQNESTIGDGIRNVFLSKSINTTDSEQLLKSARESYSILKNFQNQHDNKGKLNFIENYASFLLKLFNDLKTKQIDIYQLFGEENFFLVADMLKVYRTLQGIDRRITATGFNLHYQELIEGAMKPLIRIKPEAMSARFKENNNTSHVNVSEVKMAIETLQIAVEQHLVPHYMSTDPCFDVPKILSLNDSEFDVFLKEKFRADFSNVGYFFLEVFATLIGLSWGVISTVLYSINGPNE